HGSTAFRRNIPLGRKVARIRRRQQNELAHLIGMLRSVSARSRPPERPAYEADTLNPSQCSQMLYDRIEVSPVRGDRGQLALAARGAGPIEIGSADGNGGMLPGIQAAWIVHRVGARRAPVAGHVHRKDIESGLGEI